MTVEMKLDASGIALPDPPGKAGIYTQCRFFGEGLVYLSGCGPDVPNAPQVLGRLGAGVSLPLGQDAARRCMLNALSILRRDLGSLERIESFVKMLAFVASADDFYDQPLVANGASQMLIDLFGEKKGCPARSAIGVNVLPGNIPVEIELLVQVSG